MGNQDFDRDLNIFGSDDEGTAGADADIFGAGDTSDEVAGEVDMFGDVEGKTETTDDATDTTETKSEDAAGGEQGLDDAATDATEGDSEASTAEETKEGELPEPDAVDEEINTLLSQLESEAASENPDQNVMQDIVDDLRMTVAQKDTENSFLKKQNETLQNKLLEFASNEATQSINQPLIAKVDADPKLRAIIHLSGAADEAQKQKLANVLSEYYSQVTGVDLSSLLESHQNDKAMAALGAGGSNAGGQVNVREREVVPVAYEDSISNLW